MLALHPNQVAATRDRIRVSGGKSDRFDAFVLCELARTDHHRFRVLEPDSDQTKALRALTRAREDLVGTRTGLGNQFRAELERFWPGPIGLFSDLHSQISGVPGALPEPSHTRGLGEAQMAAFLARRALVRRPGPAAVAGQAPARARRSHRPAGTGDPPRTGPHAGESVKADIPARAHPITDPTERRQVLTRLLARLGREAALEGWVDRSPLIEVELLGGEDAA